MDMEDKLHELLPLHRERLLQTLLEGDYDAVCAPYLGLNLDTMAKYV